MARHISVEPFPPAGYIQKEIEARGWTQDDLAEVMGCSRQHVSRLLNGRTGVTPDSAHSLSAAFGTSAEMWMNLQTSYELALAAKEDRQIARRSAIYNKAPVREMVKRNWITKPKSTDDLDQLVCEFLEINSIEDEPPLSAAARKSTTYESESPEQVAWLYRAKCLAIPLTAARFEQSRFEIGLQKIRSLACYPDDARHTSKFLADLGVRLVVLQHLPRSKIDGAAFWLDEERERFPVVVLSLRYDRIDYFWHTLMHELIHIKEKHSPSADSGFGESTGGSSTSEDEKQADKEAANLLVPREKLESFIGRVGPLYSMRRIIQFAQARNIHPGIVVGQLQHCGELDYSQLRKALVKVRAEVVSAARTDGWGHAPPVM